MTTEYLFSNNATTTLAQSVSATATVLNVASGDGDLFPSPSSGQAFAVTLVDAATGLKNEICYCTSRSGDQLTVVRGQEGTNAVAWSAGDTCANYITADVMESWLQESDLDGYATQSWVKEEFQPIGDYATNTALQSEASSRESADTTLQSNINTKVDKTGDTMTGTLYQNLGTDSAVIATGMSGTPTSGSVPWTPEFVSKASNDGSLQAAFCARDKVGYYPYLSLQLTEQDGTWHELQFRNDNRLYTDSGNEFALVSDLDAYQPAGNYVTGSSAGKKIVTFTASVSGTQDISFSGLSSVDVVLGSCSTQPNSNNERGGMIQINSWTSNSVNVTGKFTSTNISDSTDLPCYFVAIGDA